MSIDIQTIKARYIDSCNYWNTVPHKQVLSALSKAQVHKSNNEESSFEIFLDDIKPADFYPLHNVFLQINISEIDVVDVLQKSLCTLDVDSVLLLLQSGTLIRRFGMSSFKPKVFTLPEGQYEREVYADAYTQSGF
ncbi:hypothetical protein Tco_1330497 [Tanacetum coccineum]